VKTLLLIGAAALVGACLRELSRPVSRSAGRQGDVYTVDGCTVIRWPLDRVWP
jgi:hypothetical protein